MFLFFAITLIIFAYLWLNNLYSYWERRGVKGPKPVFIFGNLFKSITFQEHISAAQRTWHNTYNDVSYIGFYKFLTPTVMIRDPELQREVLVKAFMNFHENDAATNDDLLKTNPFFNSGEEWRKARALFGKFFVTSKIRSVVPCMLDVSNEWKEYILSLGPNAEVDAKDISSRFTTETTLRCTFSINGKSFEKQSEFLEMGQSVFNPSPTTAAKTMLTFFLPALQRILKTSMIPQWTANRFMEVVSEQIKIRDSGAVKCDDVLQNILNSRETGELSELQIAGICMGFFLEAHETSANALSLALYQLVKNPHIQDELARRIHESIAENNNEVTFELVQKHEYLEKVLFETMRIQPTFFGIQKKCTKAYTMPLLPGQKEPVTIPAGTPVLIPFATVSQDPSIFSDPDTFDPERFSPEQKALRHKSTFMPFSDGPRMCIGMQLGLFNLKMGLFQMIRFFDVKFGPNNKPFQLHPMSFFNIPKDGIKLVLTPRKTI